MNTSDSIKAISEALVGFHKEVGKVAKDAKNPFFKSSYASLSGILDAISEPLINNGLSLVQFPEGENGLTTRLLHKSGEWMEATYTMKPVKETPQDRGSAITYQRRYAIGAILSLNIDADDDGNAASGRANGQQQQKYTPAPKGPTKGELDELTALINTSTLDMAKRADVFKKVAAIGDYDAYNKAKFYLEDHQPTIESGATMTQKQIGKEVSRKVNS